MAAAANAPPPFYALTFGSTGNHSHLYELPSINAEMFSGNQSAASIAKLVNETAAMPAGLRAVRAWDLYSNESHNILDNIMPPNSSCGTGGSSLAGSATGVGFDTLLGVTRTEIECFTFTSSNHENHQ